MSAPKVAFCVWPRESKGGEKGLDNMKDAWQARTTELNMRAHVRMRIKCALPHAFFSISSHCHFPWRHLMVGQTVPSGARVRVCKNRDKVES